MWGRYLISHACTAFPSCHFCRLLVPHLSVDRTLSVEKKMLVTIWLLSNIESYRDVADRFGFNKGALCNIASNVCKVLMSVRQR